MALWWRWFVVSFGIWLCLSPFVLFSLCVNVHCMIIPFMCLTYNSFLSSRKLKNDLGGWGTPSSCSSIHYNCTSTMNQYVHPLAMHSVFHTGNPWKVIQKNVREFRNLHRKSVINIHKVIFRRTFINGVGVLICKYSKLIYSRPFYFKFSSPIQSSFTFSISLWY